MHVKQGDNIKNDAFAPNTIRLKNEVTIVQIRLKLIISSYSVSGFILNSSHKVQSKKVEVRMKNRWIILPTIFSWLLFIALDNALGLFSTGHLVKKNKLFTIFFRSLKFLKGSTIFIIAILNFILMAGHLGKSR